MTLRIAGIVATVLGSVAAGFLAPGLMAVTVGSFMEATMVDMTMKAAMDGAGASPLIKCSDVSYPAGWNSGPRRFEHLTFKGADGEENTQFYKTHDKCPVLTMGSVAAEYGWQVGRALKQVRESATGQVLDEKKIRMVPFDKFVSGTKGSFPISCIQKCETTTGGACKCKRCTNTNEAGECVRCEQVAGGGEWVCGQFADNPDIVAPNFWANGYGQRKIGNGDVDRATL